MSGSIQRREDLPRRVMRSRKFRGRRVWSFQDVRAARGEGQLTCTTVAGRAGSDAAELPWSSREHTLFSTAIGSGKRACAGILGDGTAVRNEQDRCLDGLVVSFVSVSLYWKFNRKD